VLFGVQLTWDVSTCVNKFFHFALKKPSDVSGAPVLNYRYNYRGYFRWETVFHFMKKRKSKTVIEEEKEEEETESRMFV
jgi:hypothetical protein